MNANVAIQVLPQNCQYIAIKAGCPGVLSYVKIGFEPEGGVLKIDEKITKHHK